MDHACVCMYNLKSYTQSSWYNGKNPRCLFNQLSIYIHVHAYNKIVNIYYGYLYGCFKKINEVD